MRVKIYHPDSLGARTPMLTKIPHPQKRPHITKVCGVTSELIQLFP